MNLSPGQLDEPGGTEELGMGFRPDEGLGLEIFPKHPEQRNIANNLVRMYLHDICQIPFLTVEEERILFHGMAKRKLVSEIRQEYVERCSRCPSAADMASLIIEDVGRNAAILKCVVEEIGPTASASYKDAIIDTKLG